VDIILRGVNANSVQSEPSVFRDSADAQIGGPGAIVTSNPTGLATGGLPGRFAQAFTERGVARKSGHDSAHYRRQGGLPFLAPPSFLERRLGPVSEWATMRTEQFFSGGKRVCGA